MGKDHEHWKLVPSVARDRDVTPWFGFTAERQGELAVRHSGACRGRLGSKTVLGEQARDGAGAGRRFHPPHRAGAARAGLQIAREHVAEVRTHFANREMHAGDAREQLERLAEHLQEAREHAEVARGPDDLPFDHLEHVDRHGWQTKRTLDRAAAP